MNDPFENLSRWIMVKFAFLGGLISPFVGEASASDMPPIENLTFLEFLLVMWESIFTRQGAQAACFASIGGFVGLCYYTGTFFYKRWLFNRYPITNDHKEELKKE